MRASFSRFAVALATSCMACSSNNHAAQENNTHAGQTSGPESSIDGGAQNLSGDGSAPVSTPQRFNHLVVIILENWSFDSLYSEFQGAEGLTEAMAAAPQVDPTTGQPYQTLPQTESHIPAGLPNAPFALDPFLGLGQDTSIDLTTKFYEEQQQIHGGKMDWFVGVSAAKGLVMGYFHTGDLPLAREAEQYVLCDHFFHGVFGGSLQNHIFLISAAVAQFANAPSNLMAVLDSNGVPIKNDAGMVQDGPLTPDGYVIGTLFSVNTPHPANTPAANLVPAQTMPTIGDELSAKNVDWAWFAGGWNDALSGSDGGQLFQYHHQPFVYFANYADGAPGRSHLKDEVDFVAAAKAGSLPAVSFVKPVGVDNEHPNYTDVLTGEAHTEELIDAVRRGPNWQDTVIVVTYDEFGGFWDHVRPPSGDRWGPGTRIPTLVISPGAKRGFVDHTTYDTSAITALIEHRWGLAPLGTRDAVAADLSNALSF
jgi:phospholipase C